MEEGSNTMHMITVRDRDELKGFVHKKHEGQTRKYTGEEYFEHLRRVAEACGGQYWEPAICHDILEDTDTTPDELFRVLYDKCNYPYNDCLWIVTTVMELTNDFESGTSGLKREIRKDLEAERLSKVSASAQTIKCADIEDNMSNIFENDPDFAKIYAVEKLKTLRKMDRAEEYVLEAAFQLTLDVIEKC